LALLTVAFFCASGAGQSLESTQPARETFAAARQRLARLKPRDRSPQQRALLAALDLALAVGQADPKSVGAVIDVVGYQALPLEGELPDRPGKPMSAASVARELDLLPRPDFDRLTVDRVEVLSRQELRIIFPAVATWMLPDDLAVVFRVPLGPPVANWIAREACLVVRLRGERTTVLGGNLIEALTQASESTVPPGEEK